MLQFYVSFAHDHAIFLAVELPKGCQRPASSVLHSQQWVTHSNLYWVTKKPHHHHACFTGGLELLTGPLW